MTTHYPAPPTTEAMPTFRVDPSTGLPVSGGGAKTVTTVFNAATATATSSVTATTANRKTIQSSIVGTGAVSGTVLWYGNNTNASSGGVLIATHTLSGTTTDTTGSDIPAEWPYIYAVISAISGTGAAITSTMAA